MNISGEVDVIKVGGENATDPRTAEWLAKNWQSGKPIVAVISALRTSTLNTTTELLRAMEQAKAWNPNHSKDTLSTLHRVHIDALKNAGMHYPELEESLGRYHGHTFWEIPKSELEDAIALEQRFVGYGERMSALVLEYILRVRHGVSVVLLKDNPKLGEWDLSRLLGLSLGTRLATKLNEGICIASGYISIEGQSILEAFGRGYTDKTAERAAVGLASLGYKPTIHVQKQAGLYSADPRTNPQARPIPALQYTTAAEITGANGAGAEVLNSNTITEELVSFQVPIWVYNPFNLESGKSIISSKWSLKSWILYVDGRKAIHTVTVSGYSMQSVWFLKEFAGQFADLGISIDGISSSETQVTVTTYKPLDAQQKTALAALFAGKPESLQIRDDMSVIYCIGEGLADKPGLMAKATTALALEKIDIISISQAAGQRAITFGVHASQYALAQKILHKVLIEDIV